MTMGFQWDPEKNARNIENHGVDFEDAIGIFEGPFLQWQDSRRSYGEQRFIVIGAVDTMTLTVVYTPRGQDRRLISARRASRYERRLYRAAYPPAPEEGED
jgi:uncharacterized DUF497 family protein